MPPIKRPMNWPARRCNHVKAERFSPLVGRERIGEDRGAVGEDERRTDCLDEPKDDELDGTRIPVSGVRNRRIEPAVKMANPIL